MIWSEEEIALLKEMYPFFPREEILKEIPNRTWHAIRLKANLLNIQRDENKWTDHEIKMLEEGYATYSKEEIMGLIPDRTWNSIRIKASQKNIKRNKFESIKKNFINFGDIKNHFEEDD
jgi:hypothetical protein